MLISHTHKSEFIHVGFLPPDKICCDRCFMGGWGGLGGGGWRGIRGRRGGGGRVGGCKNPGGLDLRHDLSAMLSGYIISIRMPATGSC